MNLAISFAPVVPSWLIAGLSSIGVAILVFAAFRRVRGIWLRALAAAALALALLNPAVLVEDREPLPTVVAVVVDESASQSFGDRATTTAAMADALAERLGALDGIEPRIINAAQGEGADGTELFAALDAGLADVPPDRLGAAILLTDGQVHDVPDGASALGDAPLHALISGSPDELDRRLVVDAAPRFGIVGEEQTITFRVVDEGTETGAAVPVRVLLDGESAAVLSAAPGEAQRYTFDVPHGGDTVVELEAEALAGEITTANNRAVVQLTGVRETLRVLLVSGEPNAGERTWRNLLTSDPAVDLVHFTILRPPEKQDATSDDELSLIVFPIRELFVEKIDEFDLIIFDRYQDRGVMPSTYFDNIARFVAAGGGLLIAAGPDDLGPASIYNTSLADILPARPTGEAVETPFYPRVTESGARHPVTRDLPGGDSDPPAWARWFRVMTAADATGDVVMDGADGLPLLVLGREGEGRVAMLLSDQAWLWARGYEGGGPYVDLLRRLSHWLMQEPDLEEEALRLSAEEGMLIIERQTMGDMVGPVTLRAPDGATRTVTLAESSPGIWQASAPAAEIGLWQAAEGDLVAAANVGPENPRELLDVRSTAELLEPVIEATGGAVRRMSDPAGAVDVPRLRQVSAVGAAAGAGWLGIRMTEASTLLGIDRLPLFASFLGLAVLLGLVTLAWYREGR